MAQTLIHLTVDGRERELHVDPWRSLLHVLRDQLELTGVKLGCDAGECGACTVLVDGRPVVSCMALGADADGKVVETIDSVAADATGRELQEAFLRLAAFQCGYCAPGMVVSAKALLDANPHPTEPEIREAIAGNLCRCTAYTGIVKAVEAVAADGRA